MNAPRVRSRRSVGDLDFLETEYRAGTLMPRHAHPWGYLCFVAEGGFTEREGARTHDHAPATLIFRAPGAEHADRFGDRVTRCLLVRLGPSSLSRLEEGGRGPEGSFVLRRRRANWLAGQLVEEFRRPDPISNLALEGLALTILGEIRREGDREEGRPPAWLSAVIDALDEEGGAVPSLDSLAALAGVHPAHMTRVFRRHTGSSIGEYARRLRIERAVRLLRETSLPIGRIAHRLGYADHSHLARTLRDALGRTPGEIRASRGTLREF